MSSFYKFSIIAKTGDQGLTSIEDGLSINDDGIVAFVGETLVGPIGIVSDIFAGNGLQPFKDVTGPSSFARDSTRALQINNVSKVVTHDFKLGANFKALSGIRVRDANNPGNFIDIATTAGNTFDSLFSHPSINNKGNVVFSALEGSTRYLVTPSADGSDFFTANKTPLPNLTVVRPMIADSGEVIVRFGNTTTSPILLYKNDLSSSEAIANITKGFTNLGQSPGISDDGQIVTFYGDLSATGATALKTTPGPGIFASIKTTTGRVIERIAGIAGNGFLDPGETFQDANGNGKVDEGEDIGVFSSFDPNARVAVNSTQNTQRAVTIAYIANDVPIKINGIDVSQKGLYTNRLNFFGSGEASFNVMDSGNQYTVSSPTLIAEVGDTIPELGTEPVEDLNIYDPLNSRDRGDVAFWVKTSTSETVVRVRPREVIFLDFDPNTSFKFSLAGQKIFQRLGAPSANWSGNLDSVFSTLAPNRSELNGSGKIIAIKDAIVGQVQFAFDQANINVQVVDKLPTNGRYTHVFVGDSPYGSANPGDKNGIASDVDLFNRDVFGKADGSSEPLFGQDAALVFADSIFRVDDLDKNGIPDLANFTDVDGNLVGLNQTGAGKIEVGEVVTAISNLVLHEVGHTLGLLHLKDNLSSLVMNKIAQTYTDENGNNERDSSEPFKNELRSIQSFGTTDQPLAEVESALQNDQQRLAFTVGTDTDLPRTAPSDAVLDAFNLSPFSLRASLGGASINVAQAALGIVPLGDFDTIPEFLDLGSGDLAALLNREIQVRSGDKILLVASTNGNGIDIFGVANGFAGSVSDIDLTNGLFVLSDDRIRGDLFNDSGQSIAASLNLFQMTNAGPVQIGRVGAANASANNPPVANDDKTLTVLEDASAPLGITAPTDADGNPLTITVNALLDAAKGAVRLADNTALAVGDTLTVQQLTELKFSPAANANGAAEVFRYTVSDGQGGTDSQAITVKINAVNDGPVGVSDTANINGKTSVTIPVLANDTDPDQGDSLAVDSVTQGSGGNVTINANNTVTYTPNANFSGIDTFTYKVKDSQGAKSKDATVRIVDQAAIITVNSTGDEGDADPSDNTPDVDLTQSGVQTTLRSAIEFTNARLGKDIIAFNIPKSAPGFDAKTGVFTIQPTSALPEITDSVIIDGTTQLGFAGKPIIQLDGIKTVNRQRLSDISGLTITAGNSTVRGLVINHFTQGNGIALREKGGNVIEGNFIGTDVTGTSVGGKSENFLDTSSFFGNGLTGQNLVDNYDGLSGIFIDEKSFNNIIGGITAAARNIISGNGVGVSITSSSNKLQGNYIGTDVTGKVKLGNLAEFIGDEFIDVSIGVGIGVAVFGSNNTIGGETPEARNIISGNRVATGGVVGVAGVGAGITLGGLFKPTTGNLVQGNYIGTDVTGTVKLGNDRNGIEVVGNNNKIGGTTPGAGNIISGNGSSGVDISGFSSGNLVQGNLIGTARNGTSSLGNGAAGVNIVQGTDNTIGGTTSTAGNKIAFNGSEPETGSGVSLDSGSGNRVRFNTIFSNAGNGLSVGDNNTVISSNRIFLNQKNGVLIGGFRNDITGNSVLFNSIFANGQLGIDLGENGVTPNDNRDGDTGPNNLQNFPALTTVTSGSSTTNIEGILSTDKANADFVLQFFSSSNADASKFGEGETFLGSATITTDNNGIAAFTSTFSQSLPAGRFITATATDVDRFGNRTNTSEFSQALPVIVATGPELLINDVSLAEGNSGTKAFNFTVRLSQASTQTVTVEAQTANGKATAVDEDYQAVSQTKLTFNPGQTTQTFSVLVNGDTRPEGNETFFVRLKNATNATITDSQGVGTIQTDEPLATVVVVNSRGDAADADPFDGLPDADLGIPGLQTTLRSAIEFSNSTPGLNSIKFNIPGSGPRTIQPTSALPEIFDQIVIDGTTQPGFQGTPIIKLDGSNGSSSGESNGLVISAGNSTVRGLEIARFNDSGIVLNTNGGNVIQGNHILENRQFVSSLGGGILIDNTSNNLIGGTAPASRNVISGNSGGFYSDGGVVISGARASGNLVQGNYIGTNAAGTAALPNPNGIIVSDDSSNNVIGGTTAGSRNLISGNTTGISIGGSGNLVQGNYIGTDVTGKLALDSATSGQGQGNGIYLTGPNNTIGGTIPGARNVISGNSLGIYLRHEGRATENVVQGNFIGTAKDGTSPLGNSSSGVYIQQGFGGEGPKLNNTIGGTVRGARNIIAFNGSAESGGGSGLEVSASGNAILSNTIYSNFDHGVWINGGNSNRVLSNAIFSNLRLGIELGTTGVTPNDSGDSDTGDNNLQNFPIISGVTSNSSSTTVTGRLASTGSTNFTLEFFSNDERDSSGFGEGKTFLGSTLVKTDLAGVANFKVALPTRVSSGKFITATATDPLGNTSEFAQAFSVAGSTHTIDFNSDSKSDILWRNEETGQNAIWLMNGTSLNQNVFTTPLPNLDWSIGGAGDFNKDDQTDILWRNEETGQNAIWLMNGTNLSQGILTTPLPNLDWSIGGAGDFNKDDQTDILWRNEETGQNAIWLMNGTNLTQSVLTTPVTNSNWKIGA